MNSEATVKGLKKYFNSHHIWRKNVMLNKQTRRTLSTFPTASLDGVGDGVAFSGEADFGTRNIETSDGQLTTVNLGPRE